MEASVNKERCAVQACTLNNLAKLQYKVHETHLNNTCNKPENDPNKGKVEEKAKAGEKTESLWTLTLSLTLIGGGGEARKPQDSARFIEGQMLKSPLILFLTLISTPTLILTLHLIPNLECNP